MSNNLILGVTAATLAVLSFTQNDTIPHAPKQVQPGAVVTDKADQVQASLPPPWIMDRVYRTVYGEARGQGDTEVAAIVHVIVNRWQKRFRGASSLHDVVTHCDSRRSACQFSVWNLHDPNVRVITHVSVDKCKRYREIVDIVNTIVQGRMAGTIPDPTRGGDHYWHGPRVPYWAKGQAVLKIEHVNIINLKG